MTHAQATVREFAGAFTLNELRAMRSELRLIIEERTRKAAPGMRLPEPQAVTWTRPAVSGIRITEIDSDGLQTSTVVQL